jgi:TRAP-type uncharacterized transport system fused permease subunit
MQVGWIAVGLASGGFLVPFVFIYRPELLLAGSFLLTMKTLCAVGIGLYALNSVLFGNFLFVDFRFYETLLMLGSFMLLFWPGDVVNIIGLTLFALVLGIQLVRKKHASLEQS